MNEHITIRRETLVHLVAHMKALTLTLKPLELAFRHSRGMEKLALDLECLLHRPDHDLTGLTDSDKR